MNESSFDATVTGFFRAATGALSWDTALEPVQRAFRARAAVLHTLQPSTGRLLSLRFAGPDLNEAVFDYVREYHAVDPRRQQVIDRGTAGLGRLFHDHELFGPAFMARDRFYRHYLPAYGARHNTNVTFQLAPDVICGLALELGVGRGPLDADERDLAGRLSRYLEEALHAHERVRRMATQALAGHELLQAFAYPMWLLDVERYIGFENEPAKAERQRDARVRGEGHRLTLANERADRVLTVELQRLANAGHGARALIDLRRNRADPPVWLHLSVLVPSLALGAFGHVPQIMATLFDPAQQAPLDPFALGEVFALTPTEAKVAARLADGGSAESIAEAHGTSINTVRAHVRSLLTKFGMQRTSDIVRVLRQGQSLWAGAAPGSRSSESGHLS